MERKARIFAIPDLGDAVTGQSLKEFAEAKKLLADERLALASLKNMLYEGIDLTEEEFQDYNYLKLLPFQEMQDEIDRFTEIVKGDPNLYGKISELSLDGETLEWVFMDLCPRETTVLDGFLDRLVYAAGQILSSMEMDPEAREAFLGRLEKEKDRILKPVIAAKVWDYSDIQHQMKQDGLGEDEAHDMSLLRTAASNVQCLKMLNICTDGEWDAISDAISEARAARKKGQGE